MMKLALGTAQFGLDYGVSNTQGQVSQNEVNKILTLAKEQNIDTLDTAPAYGGSEQALAATGLTAQFNIITKIPALNDNELNIEQFLDNSLQRFKLEKLAGVLFHQVDDIIANPLAQQRFDALVNLKEQGKITKIGISVYHPEQLDFCLNHYPIDLVQLPLSTIDQRFIKEDWLNTLAEKKVAVHCRSVFLQGLLLIEPEKLPAYFLPFKKYFQHFSDSAKQLKVSPLTLALAIGHQQCSIEKIVVGCCNSEQLSEILTANTAAKQINADLSSLACEDENLIIPSNWH